MNARNKVILASILTISCSVTAIELLRPALLDDVTKQVSNHAKRVQSAVSSASGPAASAPASSSLVRGKPAAVASLLTAAPPTTATSAAPPAFDIARIDPQGTSVFAGSSAPNQTVSVIADGAVVGSVKADAQGNWVLVTNGKPLRPNATLALRATAPGAAPSAASPVRVAAAARRSGPRQTASDVNSQMMSNLQGLVDGARRTRSDAIADSGAIPVARNTGPRQVAPPAGVSNPPGAAATAGPVRIASAAPTANPQRPAAQPALSRSSLPVPIQFQFREAKFTPAGEQAANLLLQYLKLKKFARITLTGHADDRGTEKFNYRLSKDRLRTVKSYLRRNGYKGRLVLQPKGESEPYLGIDRSRFAQDELFQLDRRVELRING